MKGYMYMKKAGIFFGTGFEEIEALTVVDLLRRAGITAECVSVDDKAAVTGSHGITVEMNTGISRADFDGYDVIVCPGGLPGVDNLEACKALTDKIREFYENGRLVAAICAGPRIFGHMGIVEGRRACIYPGMESELKGAEVSYEKAVRDGNVITSRGMGTSIAFALEIITALLDRETADRLAEKIVYEADKQ